MSATAPALAPPDARPARELKQCARPGCVYLASANGRTVYAYCSVACGIQHRHALRWNLPMSERAPAVAERAAVVANPDNDPLHWLARAEQLQAIRTALMVLVLCLCAVAVNAQTPAQDGYTLLWDAPEVTITSPPAEYYKVKIGTAPGITSGTQRVDGDRRYDYLPPDPKAVYYFRVVACLLARASLEDTELCSPDSAEVNTKALQVDPCVGALPSVFVTRWTATTGLPGSRMLVNFQLASSTPIVEVQAKVDGALAATAAGADLSAFGSLWFTTPASGTHKLAVWAKNAAGCATEAVSVIPLRIR